VILFRPEHVEPIVSGRKTQTRRLGRRRWNVGASHGASTRLFDPSATFARLRILEVERWWLKDIPHEDAQAEGYANRRPSDYDRDHRFDRVYVTPNRFIARCFAAGYPSGALYQVEPVGDLESDPEHEESFAVAAARVLVVLDRCVDARFMRRGEVRRWLRMGEGA
jgi:hypothetical protein